MIQGRSQDSREGQMAAGKRKTKDYELKHGHRRPRSNPRPIPGDLVLMLLVLCFLLLLLAFCGDGELPFDPNHGDARGGQ